MGVSSSKEYYPRLYNLVDKQISDYLKRIPGVGAVQIYGGLERQINVELDKAKLQGHNLSVDRIARRLREENITLPAGNLKTGYLDYTLRLPGEFSTPEEIKNIIIASDSQRTVFLKDVAKVEDSFKEETMIVRSNGQTGMMLMVQKRSGANTVEVAKRIREKIKDLTAKLPADIKFSILLDSSEHIAPVNQRP